MKIRYHVIIAMGTGNTISTRVDCARAEVLPTQDAVRFLDEDGSLVGYFHLSRIFGFNRYVTDQPKESTSTTTPV